MLRINELKLPLDHAAEDLPMAICARLKIDAADAEVQPLIAALTGASQLTGIGSFAVDVSATGTTQEELAGTLKGTASIALRDGNISGTDFTGLVLAAKQKILAGWSEAPGSTPFTSLEGQATIEDGIASRLDQMPPRPSMKTRHQSRAALHEPILFFIPQIHVVRFRDPRVFESASACKG